MKKNTILKIICLVTLLTPFYALAQTAQALLEKDLSAGFHEFPKAMTIYSYFTPPLENNFLHPQLGSKEGRDSWLQYFVANRTGSFWDMDNHVTSYTNAGPGLYFALDPASSKEFGTAAILLNVPPGKKYISVYTAIPLSKATLNALVSEKIITPAQLAAGSTTLGLKGGFNRLTLKNMVLPENFNFRTMINAIFLKNQIEFVDYEYKSFLAGFCKVSSQSAFVFIGQGPDESTHKEGEPLSALVGEEYRTYTLFSADYGIQNQAEDEKATTDKTERFRDGLLKIRELGTSKAQVIMREALSEEEIMDLVNRSYKCERRTK